MTFVESAADLIKRGFSVIPIEPRGKRPLSGWGVTKRSRNVGDFAEVPADCNVAICADENVIILETDDAARLALALFGTKSFLTVPILLYLTRAACGSSENRPHFFFKRTEKANNVGNLVVPGLFEARFNNQYVVAPGSVHPSGAVYRWLNDLEIQPIPDALVSALIELAQSNKGRAHRTVTQGDGEIPEGSRHYTRFSILGRVWDGTKTFEEMMVIATELNERCSPPDDPAKVEAEVRDIMQRDPNRPAAKVTVVGHEPVSYGEPAIYDENELVYEFFPRGTVNILHAFSGVGKTRLMFELEHAAREHKEFLGYTGKPMHPLFILRDRLLKDYYRTLDKMKLPRTFVKMEELEPDYFDVDAVNKVAVLIEEHFRPPIVIIEGLDVMITSTNNRSLMVKVLTALQNLANHTGSAILGTWGAPKRQFNARDRYTNARAAAAGCGELPRMANTMIQMEPVTRQKRGGESIKTNLIKVVIDLRDGAPQEHYFKFNQAGRLEAAEPIQVKASTDLSYTEVQALAKLSQSGFYKHIQEKKANGN